MKFFNKKIRSTISDNVELEILLVKQALRSALMAGHSASYRERFYIYLYQDSVVVNKSEDLSANITFKAHQQALAVDKFIEQFLQEANCSLDDIVFHRNPDEVGVVWRTVKKGLALSDLLDPLMLTMRLTKLLELAHDEKAVNLQSD